VHAANRHYYRTGGLDDRTLVEGEEKIAELLKEKQDRTREEIAKDLRRRGLSWKGCRLAYLLMYAELERVICTGAPKGKHHTYALFDERVGPSETLSRDEALARLTLAYLRSRGPVTVKEFCAWATLTVADATRGLAIVANELARVEFDARTLWFRESGDALARSSRTAHFLQGYPNISCRTERVAVSRFRKRRRARLAMSGFHSSTQRSCTAKSSLASDGRCTAIT
jgi:hypothetical protein